MVRIHSADHQVFLAVLRVLVLLRVLHLGASLDAGLVSRHLLFLVLEYCLEGGAHLISLHGSVVNRAHCPSLFKEGARVGILSRLYFHSLRVSVAQRRLLLRHFPLRSLFFLRREEAQFVAVAVSWFKGHAAGQSFVGLQ